ncbi:MAG: hypothetical protein GYA12_10345 [Chloroflexi bacterium]|nr:hypothetical protein [Chloroflexota bacterium]
MQAPQKNDIKEIVEDSVLRYQAGDRRALDDVYGQLTTFCLRVISKTSGRYVKVDDDEAAVIPHVILDVLENYDSTRGAFLVYLGRSIRNRIIDEARKAKRSPSIPFSSLSEEQLPYLDKADTTFYENIIDDLARRQEIMEFESLLSEFEITFNELAKICPRQEKTRHQAQLAARLLAQDQDLCSYLLRKKMLPNKELEDKYLINRQTLDRYRKYIIATVLIIVNDFGYLRQYVLPK